MPWTKIGAQKRLALNWQSCNKLYPEQRFSSRALYINKFCAPVLFASHVYVQSIIYKPATLNRFLLRAACHLRELQYFQRALRKKLKAQRAIVSLERGSVSYNIKPGRCDCIPGAHRPAEFLYILEQLNERPLFLKSTGTPAAIGRWI